MLIFLRTTSANDIIMKAFILNTVSLKYSCFTLSINDINISLLGIFFLRFTEDS